MIALPIGMSSRVSAAPQDQGFAGSESDSQPKGNFNQFGDSHDDEDIPF